MISELRSALGIASRVYVDRNQLPSNSTLKGSGVRDVVTDLDLAINNSVGDYFSSKGIPFISEEGPLSLETKTDTFAIIDPLDGSLNYLCSLPAYGTVIAIVEDGVLTCGGIASHSEGMTAYSDNERVFYSRRYKLPATPNRCVAPSLLAYGPILSKDSKNFLNSLITSDPKIFPGFHRIGSAAHGALQFASGRFSSLICLDVRLWDIAGMLPVMYALHANTNFVRISDGTVSLISFSNELPYANFLQLLISHYSRFEVFHPRTFVPKLKGIIR